MIPTQYREGSEADYQARLVDPRDGPRSARPSRKLWRVGTAARPFASPIIPTEKTGNGKDLEAIAAAEKKSAADIVFEIERGGGAQIVNFGMNEEEVRLIMKQPWVATASDGAALVQGDSVPHPRSYGCFPRKIGRYAHRGQA